MSDLIETVSRATHPAAWEEDDPTDSLGNAVSASVKKVSLRNAKVAIAAAEPHLRRKHRQELLDELIAEAEESFLTIDDGEVVNWYHLDRPVDWLKAHRENE